MASPTSFVISTGNPENDQRELARCQQHYQAQGIMVHAQQQPQGGYLVTVYPPQQQAPAGQPGYGAAAQPQVRPGYGASPQPQYAPGGQAGYGAAPQQYAPPGQAGYGAAPQQYAPPGQAGYGAAPQQYAPGGQPGYGAAPQAPGPGYGGAPAAPYGAQPMGYGAAQPGFAPGPAMPGMGAVQSSITTAKGGVMNALFGQLTLMQKIKYGGTALFIVGMLGFSLVMMKKATANVILFENSLDVPGELSLNGKSYGAIAPKKSLRAVLDVGSYAVSFVGGGSKLDEGTLAVPDRSKDLIGYRAVYNLGGKKGIALVTKRYGATSLDDQVQPVTEGTRLVELPGTEKLESIDEPFPESMTVPKNATFGTMVHVCHVDEEKQTVGCPGI